MAQNTTNNDDMVKQAAQMNWDDEEDDYGSEDDVQIGATSTTQKDDRKDEEADNNEEANQNDQTDRQQQDQEEQKSNHGGQASDHGFNRNKGNYNDKFDQRSNYSKGDRRDNRRGGNNRRPNNYRQGGDRIFRNRDDNPDFFDKSKVNENSNYRQFYCKDPRFFLKVIDQEEPPYSFKIHAFEGNGKQEEGEDEFRNSLEISVFKTIDDYGGQNVKSFNQNERVRFTFEIEEKKKALELFEKISYQPRDSNPRMAIFYLKPEEIFEKYGDQEAQIFYAEQEKQKAERESNRDQRNDKRTKNDRRQRGGKDNKSSASNDAFIEGISFRKNQGPPTFTSKKQTSNQPEGDGGATGSHRIVTQTNSASVKPEIIEESKDASTNHRTVIETNKASSGTVPAVNSNPNPTGKNNEQNKANKNLDEDDLYREYERDRKNNPGQYEQQYDDYYPEDDTREGGNDSQYNNRSNQASRGRGDGRRNNRGRGGNRNKHSNYDRSSNYQKSQHGEEADQQNNRGDRVYRNDNRRGGGQQNQRGYKKERTNFNEDEAALDWGRGAHTAKQYENNQQHQQSNRDRNQQPKMKKYNSAFESQKGDEDQRSYAESDRQSQRSRGGNRQRGGRGRGGRGRGGNNNQNPNEYREVRNSNNQQYQEVQDNSQHGRKQGGSTNVVKKQKSNPQGQNKEQKPKETKESHANNRFQMFAQ